MTNAIPFLKKTLSGLLGGGAFLALMLAFVAPISVAQAADVLCCKCKNPAADGNVCLVSDKITECDKIVSANSKNTGLNNVVCTDKLELSTQCKTVADGGICKTIADPATYRRVENASTTAREPYLADAPTPKLNVAIPGLTFANRLDIVNERVIVPYIAQYIAALYKYLVGITVIAAAIMVTYGGFLYILGETVASVSTAKKYISDALIGLVIVFGGYTVLQLVNPFLLNNAQLSLAIVRQSPWDIGQYRTEVAPGNTPIPDDVAKEAKQELKNNAAEVPGDPAENAKAVIAAAKEVGVDACTLLAVCEHETGLRNIWSGIQGKKPKETATAFGVCQIALSNVNAECPQGKKCNTLAGRMRERFPDFPAPPAGTTMSPSEAKELKLAKIDYLLTHPQANAYMGAYILKSNTAGGGGNELTGVAGFGAGLMSIRQWAGAHGCKPTPGLTIKQAKSNKAGALSASCIPHTVAIGAKIAGASDCKDDGYDCANVRINTSSEFVGSCPTSGEKCYAMVTDDFVNYVINNYDRMAQKYGCDK